MTFVWSLQEGMLELQTILQISNTSGWPSVNQYQFSTSIVCKNVVEKFVVITLLYKKINDIINREQSIIL